LKHRNQFVFKQTIYLSVATSSWQINACSATNSLSCWEREFADVELRKFEAVKQTTSGWLGTNGYEKNEIVKR